MLKKMDFIVDFYLTVRIKITTRMNDILPIRGPLSILSRKGWTMELKKRAKWAIEYVAKENGHSDAAIAKRIGSRTDTVRRYRSEQAAPKARFIKRFCSAFGFSEDWFAKGEGDPFFEASLGASENVEIAGSEDTADELKRKGRPEVSLKDAEVLPESGENRPLQTETKPMDNLSWPDNLENARWGLHSERNDIAWIDAEISLQKLALFAGIKIDRSWIVNLAHVIGVAAWKINLSILKKQIDEGLLEKIEACGFGRSDWVVEKKPGRPEGNMPGESGDNAELMKMAREILHSGTIHATSLAMNIVSLKAALSGNPAGDSVGRESAVYTSAARTGCWDNTSLIG